MELKRKASGGRLLLLSLCFFSILVLSSHFLLGSPPDSRSSLLSRSRPMTSFPNAQGVRRALRRLGLPGSFPPSCVSKCGACAPCAPVHVPVSPGTPVIAEYYPEAWRCKCGNRFYMP